MFLTLVQKSTVLWTIRLYEGMEYISVESNSTKTAGKKRQIMNSENIETRTETCWLLRWTHCEKWGCLCGQRRDLRSTFLEDTEEDYTTEETMYMHDVVDWIGNASTWQQYERRTQTDGECCGSSTLLFDATDTHSADTTQIRNFKTS